MEYFFDKAHRCFGNINKSIKIFLTSEKLTVVTSDDFLITMPIRLTATQKKKQADKWKYQFDKFDGYVRVSIKFDEVVYTVIDLYKDRVSIMWLDIENISKEGGTKFWEYNIQTKVHSKLQTIKA